MDVKNRVVFIAGKGFFSAGNIAAMEEENLSYIIPLQRNNSLIDYSPLQRNDFKKEVNWCIFQGRITWYYSYQRNDCNLITFLDESVNQERDYLSRIASHPESYTKSKFDEKLHRFGTLTMVYRMEKTEDKNAGQLKPKKRNNKEEIVIPVEQTVYESYKQRNEIEIMFDSYKITWMQMSPICRTGMCRKEILSL